MKRWLLAIVAATGVVAAQPAPEPAPPRDPAVALREANAAATAGDWHRVATLVEPLLARPLAPTDLAEAHRLAGLAAYFEQHQDVAEAHFLAYLRIDLYGKLDPALYPPEAVSYFEAVKETHKAELLALRPRPSRYALLLSLVPPFGQFENGERTKGWVIGGLLGGFAIGNVTSYLVLRSWCTRVAGPGGTSVTCDAQTNHARAATTLRALNLTAGVGLIITYVYGVYDGVRGYRRRGREPSFAPYASPLNDGGVVGIAGAF